jgi:hypothetical protein
MRFLRLRSVLLELAGLVSTRVAELAQHGAGSEHGHDAHQPEHPDGRLG